MIKQALALILGILTLLGMFWAGEISRLLFAKGGNKPGMGAHWLRRPSGLALAREVVRLHGGDIEVNSQPDKGSTFSVSLPVSAKAA